MKRLFLAATLALVAVALAPITSASAVTGQLSGGKCEVQGTATFGGVGLKLGAKPGEANKKATYKFTSANVKAKFGETALACTGTAKNKAKETWAGPWTGVKAEVSGKGNLECGTGSEDEGGTATVVLKEGAGGGGKEWTFESNFGFSSTANLGELKVKLNGKGGVGEAKGFANFTEPEGKLAGLKAALACLSEAGAKSLVFETAEEEPPFGKGKVGIAGEIGEE